MTCKDCIHYKVCDTLEFEGCVCFKNKADYAEVKYGEWVQDKHWQYDYKCSICGEYACEGNYGNNDNLTDYCPNCGAKMDGRSDPK